MPIDSDWQQRFGGIERLYGKQAIEIIKNLHVCVVGLGGVGSWAVEALARTGIGKITVIDFDTISIENINRQLPALSETVGRKKFAILEQRVASINPNCDCHSIDDFLTSENIADYLSIDRCYDYVIDAIDSITFKAEMIVHCKRNKIPIITTGGAGGLTDPTMVQVKDLARTINDPLIAKVRSRLRTEYGFTRTPKRRFKIECVFSSQKSLYPRPDGSVSHEKPGVHGISLDCSMGYGAASFVTATFGNVAVARLITKVLKARLAEN